MINLNVILYSIGCVNCNILKDKLLKKNIEFTENNSIEEMISLGFDKMPVLSVDGNNMDFNEAIAWVSRK